MEVLALLKALMPFIQAVESAGGVMAALNALSFAQKAEIAIQALSAGDEAVALVGKIEPALKTWMDDLAVNQNPHASVQNLNVWLLKNTPPTIPGYAPDGGVTGIKNPD